MFVSNQRCGWVGLPAFVAMWLWTPAWAIDLGPGEPCPAIKFGRLGAAKVRTNSLAEGIGKSSFEGDWSSGVSFDFPIAHRLSLGLAWIFNGRTTHFATAWDWRGGIAIVRRGLQFMSTVCQAYVPTAVEDWLCT